MLPKIGPKMVCKTDFDENYTFMFFAASGTDGLINKLPLMCQAAFLGKGGEGRRCVRLISQYKMDVGEERNRIHMGPSFKNVNSII